MKKRILKLAFGVVLIANMMGFIACNDDNEDVNISTQNKSISNNTYKPVFNPNNPYDCYGENMQMMYLKIDSLRNNISNIDDLRKKICTLIDSEASTYYPQMKLSDSLLLANNQDYTQNLFKQFFRDVHYYGVKNASLIAENQIVKDIPEEEKRNLYFCIISEFKYNIYYTNDIFYAAKNFEERVETCMYNKAYEVFEEGSWIKKATYIIGLPKSYLADLADCMYLAVAKPDDKICQEKKPFKN